MTPRFEFMPFSRPDGTPYRPSNGQEGDIFMSGHCQKCVRDENQDCPIIANSMAFEVGDENYPREWQWRDGQPTCTAFEMREDAWEYGPAQLDAFGSEDAP